MSEYNPLFMDALNSSGLTPSNSWGFEPIQRFGRYQFDNPADANKFLTSDEFLNYWNSRNVSNEGIGYRIHTSKIGMFPQENAYQRPDYAKGIAIRDEFIDKANKFWKPNMTPVRPAGVDEFGRKLLAPIPVEEQLATHQQNIEISKAQRRNLARIDNRFFTPLSEAKDAKLPLEQYLGFAKDWQNKNTPRLASGVLDTTEGVGVRLPIKLVADENLPKFSLKGNYPFGDKNYTSEQHQQRMAGLQKSKLLKEYGTELGVRVSSNPENEVFVPKQVGQTKLEGGAGFTRRVGNTLASGLYEIFGAPKVSVPMQILGNMNRIGGAVVERVAAPISLGMMAYGATRDNYLDREFGHTDQFGLRPAWDFMGKITGLYEDSNSHKGNSIQQAWREAKAQVADPDWIERNQISAVPYNMVLNTGDFVQGLKDAYRPFFTTPNINRYDIAGAK